MPDLSVKIAWGTPRHAKILDAVVERIKMSRNKMQSRYDHFARMEEMYIAYIPESESDRIKRLSREQKGTQTYTTIEIPYSYAILMAAHMYWASVFLGRSPIHQYSGRHGEAESRVMGLEALIDYQVMVGQMLVPYYIWLLDAGKYGLGVLGTYWEEDYSIVSKVVEQPATYRGIPIPFSRPQKVRVSERILQYQGNRAFNIRPQDFLPDPRVPITRFQDGEFAGRRTEVGWNYILKKQADGTYFNIDVLKRIRENRLTRDDGSPQIEMPESTPWQGSEHIDIKDVGLTELHEMVIELVPREWELGSSSYPEKWVFTVANEKLIIGCQPLGLLHNQFPYDILEYEMEGYSLFKRSMLEILKPLNNVVSWLINSHFYNVRKSLNNQFIADPSRLMMTDITNPEPGKVIRVKPQAYGQDVRTMLTQVAVQDVTRSHLEDLKIIEQMIQRVSGVVDAVMGMPLQGGRRTATETRTTSSFSMNRLKINAEYMSALGFGPHSAKLVANTLQKYDQVRKFKIAGMMESWEDPYILVTPESIAGQYDFVPVDGTMPIDRFAVVNMWSQLMQSMGQMPDVAMQYDFGKIFGYMAQLGGIKNLKQFRVNVTPDERLMQLAAAGNSIPLGGGGGRSRPNGQARPNGSGGASSRPGANGGGTPVPAQVPGMGPSG
jgi:hypothetical protein